MPGMTVKSSSVSWSHLMLFLTLFLSRFIHSFPLNLSVFTVSFYLNLHLPCPLSLCLPRPLFLSISHALPFSPSPMPSLSLHLPCPLFLSVSHALSFSLSPTPSLSLHLSLSLPTRHVDLSDLPAQEQGGKEALTRKGGTNQTALQCTVGTT